MSRKRKQPIFNLYSYERRAYESETETAYLQLCP